MGDFPRPASERRAWPEYCPKQACAPIIKSCGSNQNGLQEGPLAGPLLSDARGCYAQRALKKSSLGTPSASKTVCPF
jgi:hypothetical protein